MSQSAIDEREHRRGLVLGLTLAEILILLLFLLLLALGSRLITIERETDRIKSEYSDLQQTYEKFNPLLDELKQKGRLEAEDVKTLIAKLNRLTTLERNYTQLQRDNSDLQSKLSRLEATIDPNTAQKLRDLNELLSGAARINPNDPPAVLKKALALLERLGPGSDLDQLTTAATEVEGLKRKLETAERQGEQVRQQRDNLMRSSGKGTTYPSCWTTADGKTEYIFDVTIQDNGLLVFDASPHKSKDEAWRYVDDFPREKLIPEPIFQKATLRLFQWSQQQNCRFFSMIRDGTGQTSKARYKQLRSLVENHFYPLLMSEPRPTLPNSDTGPRAATVPTARTDTLPTVQDEPVKQAPGRTIGYE